MAEVEISGIVGAQEGVPEATLFGPSDGASPHPETPRGRKRRVSFSSAETATARARTDPGGASGRAADGGGAAGSGASAQGTPELNFQMSVNNAYDSSDMALWQRFMQSSPSSWGSPGSTTAGSPSGAS